MPRVKKPVGQAFSRYVIVVRFRIAPRYHNFVRLLRRACRSRSKIMSRAAGRTSFEKKSPVGDDNVIVEASSGRGGRERVHHRALTRRRGARRGKTGYSYGTVSHSANAENVSDGDRRSQRTMEVRGRRLKSAPQRILCLISIADPRFFADNRANSWNFNENVKAAARARATVRSV